MTPYTADHTKLEIQTHNICNRVLRAARDCNSLSMMQDFICGKVYHQNAQEDNSSPKKGEVSPGAVFSVNHS